MIIFSNVSLAFNNHTVLEDVSFHLKAGEFTFLVGQTGSGKTSILRMVYMDLHPTKGSVTIGRYNSSGIRRGDKPHLRRALGIVFQDYRLFEDRSIYDNVAFALHVTGCSRDEIKKKVLRSLADVGLSHQRNKMAHELSGGEQQRVVIARALVNEPEYLLADEPTGNLDPATASEILQLLKKINMNGTGVLMATHNYELVKKMNERILQIRDGSVLEVGA